MGYTTTAENTTRCNGCSHTIYVGEEVFWMAGKWTETFPYCKECFSYIHFGTKQNGGFA